MNIGFQAVEALIDWQPRAESSGQLLWMFVCERPKLSIKPAHLKKDSRAFLEKVLSVVRVHFKSTLKVIEAWESLSSNAPASDDVVEYVKSKPLHIPFEHIFKLSGDSSVESITVPVVSRKRQRPDEPLHKVLSTASVQTSKNSRKAPYIWADSGAPVLVGVEADFDLESDALADRDYSTMLNDDLKKLLVTLRDDYGVSTKVNAPNKKALVELVVKAVASIRARKPPSNTDAMEVNAAAAHDDDDDDDAPNYD